MGLIIPFDEKILELGGCYISPKGEIISGISGHEKSAADYIQGADYTVISNFLDRYNNNKLYDDKEVPDILKHYKVDKVEDLDPFISSPLSKEEVENYKKWKEKVFFDDKWELYYDEKESYFLNRFCRYDKVETCKENTITTTAPFTYLRFFEYLVMGFDVVPVNFFYFDKDGEIQYKEPLEGRGPGWIRDFHENERKRETLWRINSENWSHNDRLNYIKTYRK